MHMLACTMRMRLMRALPQLEADVLAHAYLWMPASPAAGIQASPGTDTLRQDHAALMQHMLLPLLAHVSMVEQPRPGINTVIAQGCSVFDGHALPLCKLAHAWEGG